MSGQKTYWHLMDAKRMPTEYELLTSKLLYYPGRGFEVEASMAEWYRRHQQASPLAARDWERFADPRETTYASYTRTMSERETFVGGLFEAIEAGGETALPPDWIATLSEVAAVARFPLHGLQMAAAYIGQMAPGGRITVACAFQAAGEMRRVQHLAYRLALLARAHPAAADGARERWRETPAWQPLRRAIETLLCAYDWGEALVALNLCVKPAVDDLLSGALAARAEREGDRLMAGVLRSLDDDCRWQRGWTAALVRVAAEDEAGRAAIRGWIGTWAPRAREAVGALAPALGLAPAGEWERWLGSLEIVS